MPFKCVLAGSGFITGVAFATTADPQILTINIETPLRTLILPMLVIR